MINKIKQNCNDLGPIDPNLHIFHQCNHVALIYIFAGRIVNLETQEMRFKEWGGVDPNKSLWREYAEYDTYFLYILRIFYVLGPSVQEQLGKCPGPQHDQCKRHLFSDYFATF